jgi:hypothetical protein
MKKTHLAVAALALAIAAAPVARLQAATLASPDSRPQIDSLAQVVKLKKAKKAKARMMRMSKHRHKGGRHARSRGPGHCGENMYWGRKAGKCMDARNKA